MKDLKEYEILVAIRNSTNLTKYKHYAFARYHEETKIVVRSDNGKLFAYPKEYFKRAYED